MFVPEHMIMHIPIIKNLVMNRTALQDIMRLTGIYISVHAVLRLLTQHDTGQSDIQLQLM